MEDMLIARSSDQVRERAVCKIVQRGISPSDRLDVSLVSGIGTQKCVSALRGGIGGVESEV